MTEQPADAAPTVPDPPPHVPLVERVTALEDRLTQLAALHNRFVGDVTYELGL